MSSDLEVLIEFVWNSGELTEAQCKKLCEEAREVFQECKAQHHQHQHHHHRRHHHHQHQHQHRHHHRRSKYREGYENHFK
eukprot:2817480-Amphidinium_carterae.1